MKKLFLLLLPLLFLLSSCAEEDNEPRIGYRAVLTDGIRYRVYEDYAVAHETVAEAGRASFTVRQTVDGRSVTALADGLFEGRTGLESVILPATLQEIGDSAFRSCEALRQIVLPEGLETLGSCAFYACRALKTVTFPSTLAMAGEDVFRGSPFGDSLQEQGEFVTVGNGVLIAYNGSGGDIVLPKEVRYIAGVFARREIVSIDLSGVVGFAPFSFTGCDRLESVILPPALNEIPAHAFSGCTALRSCPIPSAVTHIGLSAFENCSSLPAIVLPEGLTFLGEYAFSGCEKVSGEIVVPNGVTALPESVFAFCKQVTRITLPDGLTAIGRNAFEECRALRFLAVPEGVTAIEELTFRGCVALDSVILPHSLERIESDAFSHCKELKKIYAPKRSFAAEWAAAMGIETEPTDSGEEGL